MAIQIERENCHWSLCQELAEGTQENPVYCEKHGRPLCEYPGCKRRAAGRVVLSADTERGTIFKGNPLTCGEHEVEEFLTATQPKPGKATPQADAR